jgi:catechol 2,3-dioxygenase-like lactoylglutathione lyase family enzyme
VRVYKISAVTLSVKNMEKSCKFYSIIPGFKVAYGGSSSDSFTTFELGEGSTYKMYLNLEVKSNSDSTFRHHSDKMDFGRIIFYTEDVDELYSRFTNDASISELVSFENEPMNASWGERFFHMRDPDGYQLSFAMRIGRKK